MKYLKFEFLTQEDAEGFVSHVENAYCTIPKVLPIEVNEEGEILLSTQWIVDVVGEDWQVPEGYEIFEVHPINPVHSIAGMEQFYSA